MEKFLKNLPEYARLNHNRFKKLVQKIKKRPPKHLDYLMGEIHQEVFEQIDCLTCAN